MSAAPQPSIWDQPTAPPRTVRQLAGRRLQELTNEEKYERWLATPQGRTARLEVARVLLEARARGYPRWSVAGAFEVCRWERRLAGPDEDGWKLNNTFRAFLARDLAREHPELDGFVETRAQRSL